MRTLLAALIGIGVSAAVAAPVPKDKKKTVEEKIVGSWKLVRDSTGDAPVAYTFTITFQKGGEMSFTRAYPGNQIPTRVSPGKFKTGEPDATYKLGSIDWTVMEGAGNRGEVSKIIELTADVLEFEDPEGRTEKFERVKDEKKEK